MKIYFIFLTFFILFCAFWYRSNYIVGNPEKTETIEQLDSQELVESNLPEEDPGDLAQISEAVVKESSDILTPQTRKELLEEYWSSLFLTRQSPDWSPSQRVDDLIELQRLLGLDSEEAFEYLDTLVQLADVAPDTKAFYATMLLARLGTLHPEEAMAYALESDHPFGVEDYENVIRLWMDKEGTYVMDWLVENEIPSIKPELVGPFLSVYAEEDPYDFMLQYQSLDYDGLNTARALDLLYESYGPGIYDNLLADELNTYALASSFEFIGEQLAEENVEAAKQWLLEKRYSVDIDSTTPVARSIILSDVASGQITVEGALDWALGNQLIVPHDHVVPKMIDELSSNSSEEAEQTILVLQQKFGESLNYLSKMLPEGPKIDVLEGPPVQVLEEINSAGDSTEIE